jgi:hypothetical protein
MNTPLLFRTLAELNTIASGMGDVDVCFRIYSEDTVFLVLEESGEEGGTLAFTDARLCRFQSYVFAGKKGADVDRTVKSLNVYLGSCNDLADRIQKG